MIIDRLRSMDRALTAREAATLLHIHYTTFYRMLRGGKVPAFRIGGTVRIDPGQLADFLQSKTRLGIHEAISKQMVAA